MSNPSDLTSPLHQPVEYNEDDHSEIAAGFFEGSIANMPIETYHTQDILSTSGLKQSMKGGEYYKYYQRNGLKETKAKDEGSLFHDRILMPKSFLLMNYTTHPKYTGTGSVAKNKAFEEDAKKAGLMIVTQKMMDDADKMYDSIMFNDAARNLIEKSQHEVSYFYTKEVDGIPFYHQDGSIEERTVHLPVRFRTDFDMPGHVIWGDLKKVGRNDLRDIQDSIFDYGYHIQNAHYSLGYEHFYGECNKGYFIYVLNEAPYTCIVRPMTDETVQIGMDEYDFALRNHAEMYLNNTWFSNGEKEIGLPHWKIEKNK